MFSADELNKLMDRIKDQIDQGSGAGDTGKVGGTDGGAGPPAIDITASKAVIIAGLLTGALSLKSMIIDRDQVVDIIVTGSLKRKTPADKAWDVLGPMPFDTVLKSILGRY